MFYHVMPPDWHLFWTKADIAVPFTYEALDLLALLFGYAISGEPTMQAFFDRLRPFVEPFLDRS